MFETGHFAALWKKLAEKLGLQAEFIQGDWRSGADPGQIEAYLAEDKAHSIKAVCVVHNETSTGSVSPISEVRKGIDSAGHPALFMVDTISGLASLEYQHDAWGVDVTVSGSQKGLMLPPGLSFNAASAKAYLLTSKRMAKQLANHFYTKAHSSFADSILLRDPNTVVCHPPIVQRDNSVSTITKKKGRR